MRFFTDMVILVKVGGNTAAGRKRKWQNAGFGKYTIF